VEGLSIAQTLAFARYFKAFIILSMEAFCCRSASSPTATSFCPGGGIVFIARTNEIEKQSPVGAIYFLCCQQQNNHCASVASHTSGFRTQPGKDAIPGRDGICPSKKQLA
jgi:hypothetical protein